MASNNLRIASKAGEVVLNLSIHHRYFLFRGNADMRKSFDGLSGIIGMA
jgi:hypothetical protein